VKFKNSFSLKLSQKTLACDFATAQVRELWSSRNHVLLGVCPSFMGPEAYTLER
jgi:hypothetical protein